MISTPRHPPSICLIGVSGYATVYIDWLLEAHAAKRIQIAAVVAPKREQNSPAAKSLQALGAKLYDDYQSLFDEWSGKIDLCFIPTGIQWHARMAITALKAGCNVLVEKPLAGSVADAESVQNAEKETGRWVAVGFQDMYTDELKNLKQSLLDGLIGPIRSVAMLGLWPRPGTYYQRNHWAGRLVADDAQVLDSPLNNAFAHFVNLSLFFAGPKLYESQKATVTKAQLYRAHDIESFDTAVVHAVGANGTRFWFGVCHACEATREPSIRITGDRGTVEWRHEQRCEIKINGESIRYEPVPNYETTRRTMFDTVLARLTSPDTPICDTGIAICHTALIESIHRAAEVVTVNDAQIDSIARPDNDSHVPAIRNIDKQLAAAFESLGVLDGIETQPVEI